MAVVALALAVWQTRLALDSGAVAKEQTDKLRSVAEELLSQTEALAEVRDSLTTKYLGQFPAANDAIAGLLAQAKSRVDLFFDIPGYGLLSNYEAWWAMKQAFETKIKVDRLPTSVALYSPARRQHVVQEQFLIEEVEFRKWVDDPVRKAKLIDYLAMFAPDDSVESIDRARYLAITEHAQAEAERQIFDGVEVRQIDEMIPLYFWMIDRREAIFAIPAFAPNASEHLFSTSDKAMIDAFLQMRDRYVPRPSSGDGSA